MTRGTQDPWGERVGQDLVDRSLVDGAYTARADLEL